MGDFSGESLRTSRCLRGKSGDLSGDEILS